MNKLRTYLELVKYRITIVVVLTTVAGYGLARGQFDTGMIFPVVGLWLVAAGSAALNQYQERKWDALMERTRNRPIPSGRVSPSEALIFSWMLIAGGLSLILLTANLMAAIFASLAVVWYNAIYTPLKRKSAFAVIPGSVIGALPPAVGWAAGGGSLNSPDLYILMFFFFIWQISHFWLLLMRFGTEYQKAGFPSLTNIYSEIQLRRITFLWSLATAISALFIPFFRITTNMWVLFCILLVALIFVYIFLDLLQIRKAFKLKKYFMSINLFLIAVVLILYLDILI